MYFTYAWLFVWELPETPGRPGRIRCKPCASMDSAVQMLVLDVDGTWTTWTDTTLRAFTGRKYAMTALESLSSTAARVVSWHAALPDPKPECFTCVDLCSGTGLSLRRLRPALTLMLGWHRAEVWSRQHNRRVKRVLYCPPGGTIPRPPRGRPRFNLDDYFVITIA